jgi:hypothetical protein
VQVVFRKRIGTGDQVLNRYPLPSGKRLTNAEAGVIAAQLFDKDYGYPFTEDPNVYWTLEAGFGAGIRRKKIQPR